LGEINLLNKFIYFGGHAPTPIKR